MNTRCSTLLDEALFDSYGKLINPTYPGFLKRLGLNRIAVRAEGATITDSEGKTYIDCIAGYGLFNLGHNHPEIIQALKEQIDKKEPFTKPFITEVPVSLAEKLAEKLPTGLFPNHFFHVVYIGCGMLTKSVKTTIRNIDNCRISYGKVKEIKIGKLVVKHSSLIRKGSKFDFDAPKTKVIDYDKFFLQSIRLNDTVAIHWNFAVQILSPEQLENLKKYTIHSIKILNKSL